MIVKKIHYSIAFIRRFTKLPGDVKKTAVIKQELFQKNPLHPSLRLHMLTGKLSEYWSISITKNYRIIFQRMENGDILFMSIGSHDIYKYL